MTLAPPHPQLISSINLQEGDHRERIEYRTDKPIVYYVYRVCLLSALCAILTLVYIVGRLNANMALIAVEQRECVALERNTFHMAETPNHVLERRRNRCIIGRGAIGSLNLAMMDIVDEGFFGKVLESFRLSIAKTLNDTWIAPFFVLAIIVIVICSFLYLVFGLIRLWTTYAAITNRQNAKQKLKHKTQ